MEPINFYKLGKRLYQRYPEVARQLINDEPKQNDTSGQIPEIYQKFINLRDPNADGIMIKIEFVAIVVKHADPEIFTTRKKLKSGVRSELAKYFKCDGSQISHNLANAKSYMKIYADFRNRVEGLYSQIFET